SILEKGLAHATQRKFDPAVLLAARLAPDMLPLTRQVQIACDLAKNSVARLAAQEPPRFEDNETSFEQLRLRIARVIDYLPSVPALFSPAQEAPLRNKAMAARPPANPPVLAVVPTPATPATVPALGQQLRDVLQGRRLHSVSVSDHEANVLWLSEGALIGPDEHGLVIEGLQALAAEPARRCYETVLEGGRFGLLLPVRSPSGDLLGVAMVLADSKSIGDDTQERLMAAPVRAIMHRLAVLMKPGAPPAGGRASSSGQDTVQAASTEE